MSRVNFEKLVGTPQNICHDKELDIKQIFADILVSGNCYDDTISITRAAIQFTEEKIPMYDNKQSNPFLGIESSGGNCRARSTLIHTLLTAAGVQSRLICTETTVKVEGIEIIQWHQANGFMIPGMTNPGLIENSYVSRPTSSGHRIKQGLIDLIPPLIDEHGGYSIIPDKKMSVKDTLTKENAGLASNWHTVVHAVEDDVTSQVRCLTASESNTLVDIISNNDYGPVFEDLTRKPVNTLLI